MKKLFTSVSPDKLLQWLFSFTIKTLRDLSKMPGFIWSFLPGILCVVAVGVLFWTVSQAQDLLVASSESGLKMFSIASSFIFFVYTLWYTSVIIIRAKLNMKIELPEFYKKHFPVLLGFICFPIMQAAILQLPYWNETAITSKTAVQYVLLHLLFYYVFMQLVSKLLHKFNNITIRRINRIRILIILFVYAVIIVLFFIGGFSGRLLWLFILFISLEFGFLLIPINSILKKQRVVYADHQEKNTEKPVTMRKFFLDLSSTPSEKSSFRFFSLTALIAFIYYLLSLISLKFVTYVGTFSYFFIALGVILGFYNFILTISIILRINFVLLLLFVAVILSNINPSNYEIRTIKNEASNTMVYAEQPTLRSYLTNWIDLRKTDIDSAKNGYPVYFVLSDGGASRSAFWVTSVLGKLEENSKGDFSQHLFCLSGASGGSLGNATFYSLLHLNKKDGDELTYVKPGQDFLKNDFLSFTLSRMLGGDLYSYIGNFRTFDRAVALEMSMESQKDSISLMMAKPFSYFALRDEPGRFPVLCINTTRMQDGSPGVISTISIRNDSSLFNNRIDVLGLLQKGEDINLSTAVVLGARFPFVSPAGNIHGNFFVDGGYFDNSGSGFVQELIRSIESFENDSLLSGRIKKLKYYVIHVTNSPEGNGIVSRVSKLANDLTSPLKTLTGSYGMQTTVNDKRLMQYLDDINGPKDSLPHYFFVSLYKTRVELKPTDLYYDKRTMGEFPYSMNWYISDTTLRRMKNRLNNCPQLGFLVSQIKTHWRNYKP